MDKPKKPDETLTDGELAAGSLALATLWCLGVLWLARFLNITN